nr:MAG TPA: hypothetical protein [Caudoviricetes sp.]
MLTELPEAMSGSCVRQLKREGQKDRGRCL